MTSGIIGFSIAMRAREQAKLTSHRREGMAEGYREGVSDGLKLAANMCERMMSCEPYDPEKSTEEGAYAQCAEAIRALIESGDYTAQPLQPAQRER